MKGYALGLRPKPRHIRDLKLLPVLTEPHLQRDRSVFRRYALETCFAIGTQLGERHEPQEMQLVRRNLVVDHRQPGQPDAERRGTGQARDMAATEIRIITLKNRRRLDVRMLR